jgi:DNA adenine methylase
LGTIPQRPYFLVDPFLGGGSVPLSALNEGLADRLVLREIDEEVAAVWQCIFEGLHESLCRRISSFHVSRESVIRELRTERTSLPARAFQTILKNRTYRGGILARGASLMKAGENGHGVRSRWYPKTLIRRIRCLAQMSESVDFKCADGFDVIRAYRDNLQAAFFVDPPYTAGNGKRAGKRLYSHNELDHEQLFGLMGECVGPFLMTYDDDPGVVALARRFRFHVERIPMKNTHHEKKFELAITRDRCALDGTL